MADEMMPGAGNDVVLSVGTEADKQSIELTAETVAEILEKKFKQKLPNAFKEGLSFLNNEQLGKILTKRKLSTAQLFLDVEMKKLPKMTRDLIKYNAEVKALSERLTSKKYQSLSDFYSIGKDLKNLNFEASQSGIDTSIGDKAYQEYQSQEDSFLKVADKLRGVISKQDVAQINLPLISSQLRELRQEIILSGKSKEELQPLIKELQRLTKLEKGLQKTLKLSPLEKFLNRFKSYATIRVFRNFFSFIERGLSDSINSLALFDDGFKDSMSRLTSQFQIMSSSVAVMLAPLIESLTPIVEKITYWVSEFANTISYLTAKLTGNSKYLKVNTEYMKEFNQEANKFSFDKFESLTEQATIDPEKMYIEADVTDGLSESMKEVLETITAIGAIVATIGVSKLFVWLSTKKAEDSLSGLNKKILDIGASVAFLWAVKEVVEEIFDLVDNWNAKSLADKVKSFCKIALYGLGAAMIALGKIMVALGKVASGTALMIGGTVTIASTGILDAVGVFANGGIAQKGDLFIANDAGPELVYSGPNNSSSIMNIAQFKQAMVEAIYECSDVFQDSNGDVVLKLDGAEIARSKRFKSELNRTNAGLHLI